MPQIEYLFKDFLESMTSLELCVHLYVFYKFYIFNFQIWTITNCLNMFYSHSPLDIIMNMKTVIKAKKVSICFAFFHFFFVFFASIFTPFPPSKIVLFEGVL